MNKAELWKKLKRWEDVLPKNLRLDQLREIDKNLERYGERVYPQPEEIVYNPFTPKRFKIGDKRAKKYLRERGFVVYRLPNFDSEKYVEEFQKFVKSSRHSQTGERSPFRFDKSETWKTSNLPPLLNGIFKNGAGHLPWVWEIRELCIPVFSEIYGDSDLLTSFDGINLSYNKGSQSNSWMHCDCIRSLSKIECYQGVVNLLPNEADDGGLLVMSGSHLIYKEYMKKHPTSGYGFYRIQMGDPLVKDLPVYKINLKPGDICIWNVLTFHCNMQPISDNLRLAVYVSMIPRSVSTPDDLEKRIKCFESGRQSNHWQIGEGFKALPEGYRFPGYRPKKIKVPELNEVQRRLVGYEN